MLNLSLVQKYGQSFYNPQTANKTDYFLQNYGPSNLLFCLTIFE